MKYLAALFRKNGSKLVRAGFVNGLARLRHAGGRRRAPDDRARHRGRKDRRNLRRAKSRQAEASALDSSPKIHREARAPRHLRCFRRPGSVIPTCPWGLAKLSRSHYAEGQRRYVESLSAYARQFLELMQKPDVDQIEGLSPAISIEQKTTSRNPRSTVGTVTEIYDYMRLLWARVGIPYSPATGLPIEARPVSRWSTASWRCRKARASTCWRRSCATARANTKRNWPSF